MVFQWYLFVLVAAVAIFAHYAGQTHTIEVHGRTESRYGWGPVLMITVPLIFLAGTRPNIGDTYAYRVAFLNMDSSIGEILASTGKDKGFSVFTFIVKYIVGDNDTFYFLIIAIICLTCVMLVYKKYSCNFAMSMFLFIAS